MLNKLVCEVELCKHNVSDIGAMAIKLYLSKLPRTLIPATAAQFDRTLAKVVFKIREE